jgi:ABC-type nitrate/sulfonate/bicarbonate transport system substrate-binding protein
LNKSLAAGIAALTLAISASPSNALSDIKILSFGGATNLPVWVAQAKGMFAKEGLNVAFSFTNGSVEQMKALYEGKADVISTAFDNIVAYTEGQSDIPLPGPADLFAFAGVGGGMNTLMSRPEINAMADIKGKVVAVDAFKSGYALVLYQILKERAGLEYGKDYTAVSVGNTDKRLAALRDKQGVAAIVGAPQDMDAAKDGFKSLADAAVEIGAYQGSALATRRAWAAAHEAEMAALIRAMVAASDYIAANKAEAAAVLRDNTKGMSETDAAKMVDRLLSVGGLSPRAAIDIKGVETVLKMREAYGEPAKKMGPPAKYVDTSFYDRATAKK